MFYRKEKYISLAFKFAVTMLQQNGNYWGIEIFREKVQRGTHDREPSPPSIHSRSPSSEESVARETYVHQKSERSILEEWTTKGSETFRAQWHKRRRVLRPGGRSTGKRGEVEVDGIENVLDRKLAENV